MNKKIFGIILLIGFLFVTVFAIFHYLAKITSKYFYLTLPGLAIILTIIVRIHQILWVRKKISWMRKKY